MPAPAYPVAYPLINGHRYSPTSCEIIMNGIPFIGVKSLNYNDGLDPGDVYGLAPQKIGRTRGRQNTGANMELYFLEFESLKTSLGAAGLGFMEVPFDVIVTYWEPPIPGMTPPPVITDTIIGARITKPERAITEGNDALTVRCDLNIMRVLYNGVPGITPFYPMGI